MNLVNNYVLYMNTSSTALTLVALSAFFKGSVLKSYSGVGWRVQTSMGSKWKRVRKRKHQNYKEEKNVLDTSRDPLIYQDLYSLANIVCVFLCLFSVVVVGCVCNAWVCVQGALWQSAGVLC